MQAELAKCREDQAEGYMVDCIRLEEELKKVKAGKLKEGWRMSCQCLVGGVAAPEGGSGTAGDPGASTCSHITTPCGVGPHRMDGGGYHTILWCINHSKRRVAPPAPPWGLRTHTV